MGGVQAELVEVQGSAGQEFGQAGVVGVIAVIFWRKQCGDAQHDLVALFSYVGRAIALIQRR